MSGYRCGRKAQSIKALFRKQQQRYHVGERHERVAYIGGVPREADGNESAEEYECDVRAAIKGQKKPETAVFSAEITQALFAVEAPADDRCERKKYQAYAEHDAAER